MEDLRDEKLKKIVAKYDEDDGTHDDSLIECEVCGVVRDVDYYESCGVCIKLEKVAQ